MSQFEQHPLPAELYRISCTLMSLFNEFFPQLDIPLSSVELVVSLDTPPLDWVSFGKFSLISPLKLSQLEFKFVDLSILSMAWITTLSVVK